MSFSFWLRNRKRFAPTARRRTRTNPHQRANFRPTLEILEDRTVPSSGLPYPTAANELQLIADINAANKAGGSYTIDLAANTTFDLKAVDNTTNGANGLPVISGGIVGKKGAVAADNLTIDGKGGTIQRDTTAPAFRLFDVASGGSLTLENVTLQDGLASGSGAAADGGAIYNQGTLTLQNTTVQNNTAQGSNGASATFTKNHKLLIAAQAGADAEGGGIWTNGTVKLEGGTIIGSTNVPSYQYSGEGNKAIGGHGGNTGYSSLSLVQGVAGGGGFGGGLYQAGGSVTMTNATVVGNVAEGGVGGSASNRLYGAISGNGGAAAGGGLDVAGGTLLMSNDPVKTNFAHGGIGGLFGSPGLGGTGGTGSGGGIYVGGGTVTLQAINLSSNQATGGDGGDAEQTHFGTTGFAGLGGNGLGGGLCVGGGAVTITGSTVNGNETHAGISGFDGVPNGSPGVPAGGGISIVAPATVSLDAFTVTNTTQNYDSAVYGSYTEDDIDGSYTLI